MRSSVARSAAFATVLANASSARADLRDVAGRVAQAWVAAGGDVTRGEPHFLLADETVTLDLRPAKAGACRRVALIGSRGLSFHVTAARDSEDDTFRVASVAGVLELQGCGGGVPDHVKVKTDSGRGALEEVVASAESSLPPLRAILLERTGGVLPPPPEPGPLPPMSPPEDRAGLAESRLARDGFTVLARSTWQAGEDGKGSHRMTLDAGCHRFDLFATEARSVGHRIRLDLDGALRRDDGDIIAEDQTAAPDVRLDACVGVSTQVTLSFEGSPHGSSVVATHVVRSLPPHLPALWGPEPRARFGSAILEHHVASPTEEAVLLARGASGQTPLPLELEPGACYLAVAVLEHAHGHGLGLHVVVGDRRSDDDRGSKQDAAITAFCANGDRNGRMEVDARSAGSGWELAVFRMEGGAWGTRP